MVQDVQQRILVFSDGLNIVRNVFFFYSVTFKRQNKKETNRSHPQMGLNI